MLRKSIQRVLPVIIIGMVWFSGGSIQAQDKPTKTVWDRVYSDAQAKRGADAYRAVCSGCHRGDLSGYNGVLRGTAFMERWREDSVQSLFNNIKKTMPRNDPGILKDDMYLDIVTFLLQQNTFPVGTSDLSPEEMKDVQIVGQGGAESLPAGALALTYGCITAGPNNTWLLTAATAPSRTRNPEKSSDDELKAAAGKAAGSVTFRLIEPEFYHPERHKDERVEAKGFLMKDPADGLSLTALTTIAPTCGSR